MLCWTVEIKAAMRVPLGSVSYFQSLQHFSCVLLVLSAGPPEIMQPKVTEMEDFLESDVDLTCDVRGFPAPTVTWTSSDGKVQHTETKSWVIVSILMCFFYFILIQI